MGPADVIAERFEIESRASAGGMGAIFRAKDRTTGDTVALKVIRALPGDSMARFAREAEVLAELRHPGIVRYIAHGDAGDAGLFIAMEWLDGTDLLRRLSRKGLTLGESLGLAQRVAEALAVGHARGIVHRDVKPGNIFLVGDDLRLVKLLDFGIARVREPVAELTVPGVMIGTPGYMSPEQARSMPDVDARADVYGLGCVLFRCIAGRLPFTGSDPLSLIAKAALEEPPRLADFVPAVPPAIDALVGRMIARDRAERPRDGADVANEIRALGDVTPMAPGPTSQRPPALTSMERRLVFLVLAREAMPAPKPSGRTPETDDEQPTSRLEALEPDTMPGTREQRAELPTRSAPRLAANDLGERIFASARTHGGRATVLLDGSVVVTFTAVGGATDLATRAARCAITIHDVAPAAPVSVAAGRADVSARLPLGEVIDRAIATSHEIDSSGATERVVAIDEVSAALLEERFHVVRGARAARLIGERSGVDAARTVLGRATAFVGRERELQSLQSLYEESAEDRAARGILVSAPTGVGKSRLRREYVQWLRDRPEASSLLLAAADPHADRSAYALFAQALRGRFGIAADDPAETRREKLVAHATTRVAPEIARRVSTFLGAMLGIPHDDTADPQWHAAAQNPVLMGDQIRRAFEDWLRAECAAQPVAIVFDDVQWADASSMELIETALRNLPEVALLVVAFARPEVRTAFPVLFADLPVSELKLAPLTRRSADRLAREILGASVPDASIDEIVTRAGGNAFYLEELARGVASGLRGSLPETVLALVQSRLEALEEDARRLLRAASIFGRAFPKRGVLALLGGNEQTATVSLWLDELMRRDLIAPHTESGARGEGYVFRQELLRDAAYAMLTEPDRKLGHRLAADWLIANGPADARVVAEHFVAGDQPERASVYFVEASQQALLGSDLGAVVTIAERGVECGAEGATLGMLRLAQAQAQRWRGENESARRHGLEAMALLEEGSRPFCEACGEVATAAGRISDHACLADVVEKLVRLEPTSDAVGAQAIASARACVQLIHAGETDTARALLFRAEQRADRAGSRDPSVRAHLEVVRRSMAERTDLGRAYAHAEAAVAEFDRAGDRRSMCMQRINLGFTAVLVGRYEEAERTLREAVVTAEQMGLGDAGAIARQNLGLALMLRGSLSEAQRLEEETAAALARQNNRLMEGGSRVYLARILLACGAPAEARRQAELACALSAALPAASAYAHAALGAALLALGETEPALAEAREAMDLSRSLGTMHEGDVFVQTVLADALAATGRGDESRVVIERARELIVARAEGIEDEAVRRSFLRAVENAALLDRWRAGE